MQRIYINDNWYFTKNYTDDLLNPEADLSELQKVRIPHSVCELSYSNFDEMSVQQLCGYRRSLIVEDAWRGGHLILTFEGAAHEAAVYVNGKLAMKHYGGYTAFSVDIVPFLVDGREQVITVRLDSREKLNQPPFGSVTESLTYGGIYRDVYLDVKDEYYIEDIYTATPDVRTDEKILKAQIKLNAYTEGLRLAAHLDTWTEIPLEGEDLQHWDLKTADVHFRTSCLTYTVPEAMLWDVDMPILYVLTVELLKDGQCVDTKKVRVGFREAVFDGEGFWLNGRILKLCGFSRYQSWPYVGYAMPKSPQQLDADLLKFELGANAVRTMQGPQSQYFMDRCDEIGLLVIPEIPGWQFIGDTRWKKIAVRNVREMVMQYRNHPSVILWDTRISDSDDEDALYYKTSRLARELDVYRQTGGERDFAGSHFYEDVYLYDDMSEDAASASISSENIIQDLSKTCLLSGHRSLNVQVNGGAGIDDWLCQTMRQASVWRAVESNDSFAGSLAPVMTDYPVSRKYSGSDGICSRGLMDAFRNPKMAAAFFKSQREDEPVCAAVLPMDDRLMVMTNADHILLYCDEKLIGEFYPDETVFRDLVHPPIFVEHLSEIVRTGEKPKEQKQKGTSNRAFLKKESEKDQELFVQQKSELAFSRRYAVTWRIEAIKDDTVVAGTSITPTPEVRLQITTDRQHMMEESSYDAATVHIEAVGESGQHLYGYETPLVLKTEGDIELIGPSVIVMKNGFAGTYVRSIGKAGSGRLMIQDGHGEAVVEFSVEV